jgi:RNA-directed DNA polymerase
LDARHEDTRAERSSGIPVATKLCRIAEKARKEPACRFVNLFHLLKVDLLRECFEGLRGSAAPGIDQVTKEAYARNLEENLASLEKRLHQMSYRPQPVRRVYIPKPGKDKQRPLGIPVLEDKLVQAAMVKILEQIYEQDFIEDSYGFRPGRSCHDALRALSETVEEGRVEWLVEADIKGFFDHVNHDRLMELLNYRVGDPRMVRMVKRFLKAGITEDGAFSATEEGTPQGGVISPLLANLYLHYALDVWFEQSFRPDSYGCARLIRYADDFVVCFTSESDARIFQSQLVYRLAQYGLEVEPTKTKVIPFGPGATGRKRLYEGKSKPETFDFLGFTHYCSRSRSGKRFRMKRRTSAKCLRTKLKAFAQWLRANRARLKTRPLWEKAAQKIQGHYRYYGVSDNYPSLKAFGYAAERLLFKTLNRRGGKRKMTWKKFNKMKTRHPLPCPRIYVKFFGGGPKPPQQLTFTFA